MLLFVNLAYKTLTLQHVNNSIIMIEKDCQIREMKFYFFTQT